MICWQMPVECNCLYSLSVEEEIRVFQTVPVGGQVGQRKLCLSFSSICVAAYHLAIGAILGIGREKRALLCAGKCQLSAIACTVCR